MQSYTVFRDGGGAGGCPFIYCLRHRNAANRAFQVVVMGMRMMIGIRIRIIEISFTYRFVKRKKIHVGYLMTTQ